MIKQMLKQLAEMMKMLFGMREQLKSNSEKFFEYTNKNLNKSFVSDVDYDGDVDKEDFEVGCCITYWNILNKATGIPIPPKAIAISTYRTLHYMLENPHLFKLITDDEPKEGDAIISPSGYQANAKTGHIGILLKDHRIASNNSYGINAGKITSNYTLAEWTKKWSYTRIFRLV